MTPQAKSLSFSFHAASTWCFCSSRPTGRALHRSFCTSLAKDPTVSLSPCRGAIGIEPMKLASRLNRIVRYSSSTSDDSFVRDGVCDDVVDGDGCDDNVFTLRLEIPTPEDMEDVGAILSMGTGGGDTILLDGDLGAGKTCFSRGFVRARTGQMDMSVTSPTYLLSNTYAVDGGETTIHHMDLYRLSGAEEDLEPLDIEHVLSECISLIEWPARLGAFTPPSRLDVTLTVDIDDEEGDSETKRRYGVLRGYGSVWKERLQHLEEEGYLDDLLLLSDEDIPPC